MSRPAFSCLPPHRHPPGTPLAHPSLSSPLLSLSPSPSRLATGSLLGLVSSIVVIAFYMKYSVLRTHTNTLLFWRTVCDGGLALLFLSYVLTALSKGGPGQWNDIMSGKHRQEKILLAGLFQFFTISSETWFFCNSRDLMLTLTDPFTSDKANLRNYHAFSWSLSLIMSSVMATPNVWGKWYVGGKRADHYPVFYLRNIETKFFTNQTWWHILLFYGPVLSIYVYALRVFTKTFMQFKHSKGHIASTLSARLHILAANAVNIIVYLGYWTIFAIAYSITYAIVDLTNSKSYYVRPSLRQCLSLYVSVSMGLSLLS